MNKQNKTIHTSDINDVLKAYTQDAYSIEKLDFNILKVETVMFHKGSIIMLDLENIDSYKKQKSSIKQSLEIQIFKKQENRFDIKQDIYFEDFSSRAYMKIHKDSKIPYSEDLEKYLIDFIRKEKAKKHILIDTQDGSLEQDVATFVKLIKDNKRTDNFTIQIYNSTSFVAAKEGYIKYPYTSIVKYKELARNFLFIEKDAVVVEVFAGVDGKSGFNCLGELRSSRPINKIDASKVREGQDVLRTESEDTKYVRLVANISGVVSVNNWTFRIDREFTFTDLNFKICSLFKAPLSEDITVNIHKSTDSDDAIGNNVSIHARHIKVSGSLGFNSSLFGNIVEVVGSTHQASHIVAKECSVQLSRGSIVGDSVKVVNLEHGNLHGKTLEIVNFEGGEAQGESVFIDNMNARGSIMASKSIEIGEINVKGGDFTICARGNMKYDKDIKHMQNEIKIFQDKHPDFDKDKFIARYEFHIKKAKALKEKQNSTKTSDEIQKILFSMQHMKETFTAYKKCELYELKLEKYDSLLFKGMVVIKNDWLKDSMVFFKKVSSNEQISCSPDAEIRKITLSTFQDKEIIRMDV